MKNYRCLWCEKKFSGTTNHSLDECEAQKEWIGWLEILDENRIYFQ